MMHGTMLGHTELDICVFINVFACVYMYQLAAHIYSKLYHKKVHLSILPEFITWMHICVPMHVIYVYVYICIKLRCWESHWIVLRNHKKVFVFFTILPDWNGTSIWNSPWRKTAICWIIYIYIYIFNSCLLMAWWSKDAEHQQAWYLHWFPGIFWTLRHIEELTNVIHVSLLGSCI